jgi:hypothetical protein
MDGADACFLLQQTVHNTKKTQKIVKNWYFKETKFK